LEVLDATIYRIRRLPLHPKLVIPMKQSTGHTVPSLTRLGVIRERDETQVEGAPTGGLIGADSQSVHHAKLHHSLKHKKFICTCIPNSRSSKLAPPQAGLQGAEATRISSHALRVTDLRGQSLSTFSSPMHERCAQLITQFDFCMHALNFALHQRPCSCACGAASPLPSPVVAIHPFPFGAPC
jgi:hypothetical protein